MAKKTRGSKHMRGGTISENKLYKRFLSLAEMKTRIPLIIFLLACYTVGLIWLFIGFPGVYSPKLAYKKYYIPI
jgi:hypothetical protein